VTSYTKRDIRAADMLAMMLVGIGIVLVLFAALPVILTKADKNGGSGPALWIAGGVFILLGAALALKIRQLVRNRGREPEDYPGVPE